MEWRQVSSNSSVNITYDIWEYLGEYIYLAQAVGPVGMEERLPFIRQTLKTVTTGNYFCIVNHRDSHDSVMTYDQMVYFGDLLRDAGIRRLYYAVVTHDAAYANVARLIEAVATLKEIHAEVLSTADYTEAEEFITRKIIEVADK